MRKAVTVAAMICLSAATVAAAEPGFAQAPSTLLQVTPGSQIDVGDEDESGFLAPAQLGTPQWADTIVLQSLSGAEAQLLSGLNFSAGISTRADPGRPYRFGGVSDGRPGFEFGAFGAVGLDEWTLTARVGQEVLEGHGGFVADLGLKWADQILDGLTLELGSGVSWADESYMDAHFGGSDRRAFGSGLRLHDAAPGLKDFTVSGSVTYSIGDNWTVGGLLGAQKFLGSAAASPEIEDDDEYFGGVSVGVRF